MNASKQKRRGAVLIEFAFVAILIFMIFFGMVEIARAYMVKHLLFNAARAGCRQGIVDGKSTADIQAAVNGYLATYRITGSTVTVSVNGNSSKDVNTAIAEDKITVEVSTPYADNSWVPVPRYVAGNMTSSISYRHE